MSTWHSSVQASCGNMHLGGVAHPVVVQAARDAIQHTANTAVASILRRACTTAQQVSVAERVCDSWMHGNPRVAKISCMELGRMLTRSGINTG